MSVTSCDMGSLKVTMLLELLGGGTPHQGEQQLKAQDDVVMTHILLQHTLSLSLCSLCCAEAEQASSHDTACAAQQQKTEDRRQAGAC